MYDTVSRAFITLGQVMKMIADGVRVKIIDKESGLDITNPIRVRAIANEAEGLARRMAGLASRDTTNLHGIAKELGKLTREMVRLRELVRKEAQNEG